MAVAGLTWLRTVGTGEPWLVACDCFLQTSARWIRSEMHLGCRVVFLFPSPSDNF